MRLLRTPTLARARLACLPACPPQVCSLAGGLLNVLRIPERWLQPEDPTTAAPLDFFLNSHQVPRWQPPPWKHSSASSAACCAAGHAA